MKVAVLALQGDFAEHIAVLKKLGAECFELRQKADVQKDFDFLILPGGESTVQSKLLHDLDMFGILKEKIESGIPVFATCAGLILLSMHFNTLPVTVRRNAYGRQLGSFYTQDDYGELHDVPMTFIRGPVIQSVDSDDVHILTKTGGNIVAVKYKNQTAVSFHPELNDDYRVYKDFLKIM